MDGKCSRCLNSKCCTYTTEALGVAPRSKADFEHLLWQVSHQGVEIYKDEDGWFL
ncbi:MAG: YkgJ family cysteine cluster protein, partial [gamma proteobacterium symbiont of Ctena orbiculata]